MVQYDILLLLSALIFLLALVRFRVLSKRLETSLQQEQALQAKVDLNQARFEDLQDFLYKMDFEQSAKKSQLLESQFSELEGKYKALQSSRIQSEIDKIETTKQKNSQIESLAKKINELEDLAEEKRLERQEMLRSLDKAEDKLSRSKIEIEKLKVTIATLESDKHALNQEIISLSELEKYRSIEKVDKEIASRLQAAIEAVRSSKSQVVEAKEQAKTIIDNAELEAKKLLDKVQVLVESDIDYDKLVEGMRQQKEHSSRSEQAQAG